MPKPREKSATVDIKIRMREPVRARIEAAAAARGVSMNTEMVDRLERSYYDDAMPVVYGQQGATLLKLIGSLLGHAPGVRGLSPEAEWLNDPTAYDIAAREIIHLLEKLRPPGEPLTVAGETPEHRADRALWAVGDENPDSISARWATSLRDGLGKNMSSRIVEMRKFDLAALYERETNQ